MKCQWCDEEIRPGERAPLFDDFHHDCALANALYPDGQELYGLPLREAASVAVEKLRAGGGVEARLIRLIDSIQKDVPEL